MTRSFLSLLCVLCGEIGLAAEPGMVFIPGGAFSRGRSYDWPDTRLPWYRNPLKDDTPVRKIYIDPFYMDEAEVLCDRVAIIDKGKVIALDTPKALIATLGEPRVITHHGTLEDVFMARTGRLLRED